MGKQLVNFITCGCIEVNIIRPAQMVNYTNFVQNGSYRPLGTARFFIGIYSDIVGSCLIYVICTCA